jgi:hypothetical protein
MKEGLLGGTLQSVIRGATPRPCFVLHAGLDLSRERFDCCLLDVGGDRVGEGAAPPDGDGLAGLVEWVRRRHDGVRPSFIRE